MPGRPARTRRADARRRRHPHPHSATSYCASDAIVICCCSVTPGAPGSTRKRSTSPSPSPVRASTTIAVADDANGTCHFTPSSTNSSPSARGAFYAPRRKPLFGPSQSSGQDRVAGDDARQPLLLLLLAPRPQQHAGAHHRAHEVRRRRERAPELHVDDRALERAHLRAAVLGRDHEPDQVELGHLLPELGREPDGIVLQRAHRLERRVRAAHAAHHLPQHLLLGREVEIHQFVLLLMPIRRSDCGVMVATGRRGGSRDCRRRRSAARCARCSRS